MSALGLALVIGGVLLVYWAVGGSKLTLPNASTGTTA